LTLASLPSCQPLPPPNSGVVLARTEVQALRAEDGQVYRLSVSLPRDYARRTGERFATVFVLDPEFGFAVVRNVVEHLSDRHRLPELIVVGIGYPGGIEGDGWLLRYRTQRTRDYTPTSSAVGYPGGVQQVSGGADRFLDFLERRLVPFIDERYRTSPGDRTLIGHSYGGLLGAYAALTRPALFSREVLVSPSLWYDHHFIARLEAEHRAARSRLPARLFFAAGARERVATDGDIAGEVEAFTRTLRALPAEGTQVEAYVFDDETHDTVFPAAVTRGLRVVFDAPAPAPAPE
jgi:predicted alpha/beta superfamily hydrolase